MLDLKQFGELGPEDFGGLIDLTTDRLLAVLPSGARFWGLARKVVNIFLRDCLYNSALVNAYALERHQDLFELPLDSYTGSALFALDRTAVPRWGSVRGLTPELSLRYQALAKRHGDELGVARVHLDAMWWGERAIVT